MAAHFMVRCPSCGGDFPCHTELWNAGYDLLCPFCQATFPQDRSPLVVSAQGEQGRGPAADATAHAEGM